MANDRNIVDFINGQVVSRSYEEIFNMLVTNMRSIYGEDIDISQESPQGQELRFLAGLFEEFSSLMGNIFNTFNIYQAQGWHLDRLVKFATGMDRLQVDYTRISSITITLPVNAIDLVQVADKTWEFLDSDGVKWLRLPNTPVVESPLNTFNISLTCNSTGDHYLSDTSVLSQLYIAGQFVTDNISISGIPIVKSVGSFAEEDKQFLHRMIGAAAKGSRTLAASLKEGFFSSMPGTVRDVVVINSNNGDGSDVELDVLTDDDGPVTVGVPVHDIFVIVQPVEGATIAVGSNDGEIAKLIQDKMTPGISTMRKVGSDLSSTSEYLTVDLPVNDLGILLETVRFKVASVYDPVITVHLSTIGVGLAPSAKALLEAELRSKIENLSLSYTINQPIDITAIRNLIGSNSNHGVRYIVNDSLSGGNPISIVGGVDVKYGHWKVTNPATQVIFSWSAQ